MNITTIGRGNIGGGLARLWEQAGHSVTMLGRDGGDASDADVVLVAVPSGSISDALAKVTGLEGKTTIDAANASGDAMSSTSRSRTRSRRRPAAPSRRPSMRTSQFSTTGSASSAHGRAACTRPTTRRAKSRST
jgi:predicted dinucleotide-binding enzyme